MITRDAIARLDARLATLDSRSAAPVRQVRRELSREVRSAPARMVLAIARALVRRNGPLDRFIAYEALLHHPPAMAALDARVVRRLGDGMASWSDVDTFACYVAGPAWRTGRLTTAEIARWARSDDRWWRRAAVASTVPLNCAARGGTGDRMRTLRIAELVVDDRDPMVAKALSWSLRELSKREPAGVRQFVARHRDRLPSLVIREVRTKLTTGRKSPSRAR